jgi:SAM-dependent methyltransferase
MSEEKVKIVHDVKHLAMRSATMRAAYRWLRAGLVGQKEPELFWSEGLPSEVHFWERALPGRVAALDQVQAEGGSDPEAPVRDPVIRSLIGRIPEQTVSIIDVGSGPLTALGKTYPGKTLKITATDPLAADYAVIMREAGIDPPVAPIACRGEDLLDHFQPASFDIAFAKNALDHAVDPVRVIKNMVRLVKDGRFVVLKHNRNEGERRYYGGLHQWNFDVEEGDLVIWRPRRERVHMNRALHGIATVVECFMDDSDWLVCLIMKSTR